MNFMFNILTNLQTIIQEKIKKKTMAIVVTIKDRFLTRYAEIKGIFFHSVAV